MGESRQVRKYREIMGESNTMEHARTEVANAQGSSVDSYIEASEDALGLAGADMHEPTRNQPMGTSIGGHRLPQNLEQGMAQLAYGAMSAGGPYQGSRSDQQIAFDEGHPYGEGTPLYDAGEQLAMGVKKMTDRLTRPSTGMQGLRTDQQIAVEEGRSYGDTWDQQNLGFQESGISGLSMQDRMNRNQQAFVDRQAVEQLSQDQQQMAVDEVSKTVTPEGVPSETSREILAPIQDPTIPPEAVNSGYVEPEKIERPNRPRNRRTFETYIQAAAVDTGLDPNLIAAIMKAESGYNWQAQSTLKNGQPGAKGLMQLMPATAKELGVTDIWDPGQNIMAGARYYKEQLDRFGTRDVALAAYNAGPRRVREYGNQVPPFGETTKYIRKITADMDRYEKEANRS
jgi:hypothetical protein